MPRITLKPILENNLPTDVVIIKQQMKTNLVGPYEESALICGNCSRTLIHGFSLEQFHNEAPMGYAKHQKYVVLQCPQCNTFNDTAP